MLTDDMKRVISEQRIGYVATVCPDGTPNLSPSRHLHVSYAPQITSQLFYL